MIPRLTVATILVIIILCFPSYSAEKIKITFLWWPDPVGGFEEVISDFEEANLDIDVERL